MSPTASAPPALDKLDFDAADLADVEHGNEQAVYFCMLAEFDIDTGATLAHQYPYPTGTDEQ